MIIIYHHFIYDIISYVSFVYYYFILFNCHSGLMSGARPTPTSPSSSDEGRASSNDPDNPDVPPEPTISTERRYSSLSSFFPFLSFSYCFLCHILYFDYSNILSGKDTQSRS